MTVFMTNMKSESASEVVGPERRRRWSVQDKLQMVRESYEPGNSVSMVARRHEVNPNQLFQWRKLHQSRSSVCRVRRRGSGPRIGACQSAPGNQGLAASAGSIQAFALDIGLQPVTTPVCSPQSNGMAESFVKTMKRDYIAFMPKPDARTAIANLGLAFEH